MPVDQLAAALGRAAQRVPGSAAQRSLAAIASWRPIAVTDVPIPDPAPAPAPLRVAPNEMWCKRCYEATATGGGRYGDAEAICPRCGGRRFTPATLVLRPGEYVVAS